MIKRYSQFVKENKQVNENIEEFDEIPSNEIESEDPDFAEVEDNEVFNQAEEELGDDNESEEEGGSYIGQEMIQNLADALDTQVDTDGSINYNGEKINFYSETEMFHIGNQKFETVDEVVDFLENENGISSNDGDIRQRELEDEDDKALLAGQDEEETEEQPEFESKSYKHTRKFESFRKK